jgi:hypothetical protein
LAQGPIENPVINSRLVEPQQYSVTTADGQVVNHYRDEAMKAFPV